MQIEKEITEEHAQGMRLDKYISEMTQLCTRSQLKARAVSVHVNGEEVKLSKKIHMGDKLVLHYKNPEPPKMEPQNIPLSVLFENKDIVFINKPQGMVVHPAQGNYDHTLVQALLYRYKQLNKTFPGDFERPGIVHRLDKDTSGIIVVAKNLGAHHLLAEQFKRRRVKKAYLAVIKGWPGKNKGMIDTIIVRDPKNRKRFIAQEKLTEGSGEGSRQSGKKAITEYTVLKRWGNYTFIKLSPKTGRTHQLRVHMKHLGTPILGDPIYGRKNAFLNQATLMLHAWRLSLTVPDTKEKITVYAPLPNHIKAALMTIAREPRKN